MLICHYYIFCLWNSLHMMLFTCVVHVLRLTTHALTLIACPYVNMSRKCVERTTWFEMCNMFVEHMYYSLSRVLVIWFQHNCTIIPLPSRYLTSMKLFFGGNTLTTNPLQTLVKQFDPTLTTRSSSMLSFFQWRRSVLPPHESRDQKRHKTHVMPQNGTMSATKCNQMASSVS